MSRLRRERTSAQSPSRRSTYTTVRSFLAALVPLGLWFMEQSLNALVFALVVAVVESAVRLRETGLWGSAFHADEAGFRRASSSLLRALHIVVSAARRVLWRSTVTAFGGLSVTGVAPAGPCVVVANHRSHADAPALLAALSSRGRPRVAAAADHWFACRRRRCFCRWFVGGFAVRRTGGGREDLLNAVGFLRANGIVVVFPEGTRGSGPDLGRFHRGAFDVARVAGVPVVPAAIAGTKGMLPKHSRGLHRARIQVEFAEPQHALGPEEARVRITGMLRRLDAPHRPSAPVPSA